MNKMNAMALSIVFGSVLFRLVISISYQLLDTVTGFYVSAHRIDGGQRLYVSGCAACNMKPFCNTFG